VKSRTTFFTKNKNLAQKSLSRQRVALAPVRPMRLAVASRRCIAPASCEGGRVGRTTRRTRRIDRNGFGWPLCSFPTAFARHVNTGGGGPLQFELRPRSRRLRRSPGSIARPDEICGIRVANVRWTTLRYKTSGFSDLHDVNKSLASI